MHPYNINFIYSELNESFDINSFDAEMIEKDGTFEIGTFLDDLRKLYNAVMLYVALEGVCVADDETAYDLSKEGKYFEGYSFFDKYKRPTVTIPNDLDYGKAKGNLLDIIRKSNRQEFCDSEDCQNARNARKQKAYRDRKASKKAHLAQKRNKS